MWRPHLASHHTNHGKQPGHLQGVLLWDDEMLLVFLTPRLDDCVHLFPLDLTGQYRKWHKAAISSVQLHWLIQPFSLWKR